MAAETFDLSELGTYKYGFAMPERYVYKARKGLSREIVEEISWLKGEPDWMREFRLRALEIFLAKPMPTWGADLSGINFDDIYYYIKPTDKKSRSWDEVPEEIRRTFELLGIPEAERKFLAGVGAQYECLSGEVRVYTARGPIPIRDVQPGDIVFSYEEESGRLIPARVRATAFKGEREVFEVRVGTRTIRATANHPFLVLEHERASNRQRGRYRLTWKYLYELKPGDLVAVARRLPDVGAEYALQPLDSSAVPTRAKPVRFPERTSTDLMWWLGVYIGDGFLRFDRRGSKGRIEFAIPETDEALRRELQRVTRELFGIEARNGDPYRLTVYSTALARYLKAHGFEGNAHTKRVPQWVFSLPEEQRLAFLGGYVDADGYVRNHRGNRNVVLTSVNAALLEDMQALARTCGIRTSNIHRFESKHPKDPERRIIGYRLQLSGDFERIGCRSPQRIERFGLRKYHHKDTSAHNTTFRSHINEFIGFARIDAIIPAGVEPVYDIEVEGPHNFVAEGLIVHNSEVVYHNLQEHLRKLGVIFVDTDTAVREYPDLVREYFGTVVPPDDNKFAALNSAVWSGGSFIYVPPGVHVDLPLQAYFRINAQNVGQFERTLIIAEEGAFVHYVEGCLPAGEQVSTGERWVNIEAIRPGDFVVTETGRKAKVRAVMVRPYRGDLIEIQPISRYNTFRLTPEHPVLVVRREDVRVRRRPRNGWRPEVDTRRLLQTQPVYVPAGELQEGDFLVFPKIKPEGDPPPFTPEQLRLLGYYLAEGSAYVHKTLNQPVVAFSFGEHEVQAIEEVKRLIHQVTGKKPQVVRVPGKHAVTVSVYSRELMEFCLEHAGKGAANKQLSEAIMALPPEQVAPLLEAYFAGDGNRSPRRSGELRRIATASETLARQIQELLARQGIYASIQVRKGGPDSIRGRRIQRRDQFILTWTHGRRMGEVRDAGDYFLVPIKAIRRVPYEGFVFNLDVEDPNSYLVRGFAVHNCTAPIYTTDSLHSAVVEIIVKPGARVRYTTIQNWSTNVYNLVTKRAVVYRDAVMEWVDCNLGSKVTMKYPSVYLMEPGARGEILSIAFAGRGQHQDAGGKAIHAAPHTRSRIISKSISKDGGRTSYRGLVRVYPGAEGSTVSVNCDALILDEISRSDTYPYMEIEEDNVTIGHEATVSKISDEQLFYLMSRGIPQEEAAAMIVTGFVEPLVKELPMEYAVEMNRLIRLQMSGSVG
jgi:Fe-S cluster assembly protein SufB